MAPLIPDERWVVLVSKFFISIENATGYIRDRCCHLKADGAQMVRANFTKMLRLQHKLRSQPCNLQNIARSATALAFETFLQVSQFAIFKKWGPISRYGQKTSHVMTPSIPAQLSSFISAKLSRFCSR